MVALLPVSELRQEGPLSPGRHSFSDWPQRRFVYITIVTTVSDAA
jgi:hypothetical protein